MMDWFPDAVTKEALQGLKKYKYSAIDLSPISNYILQPYWKWAVSYFPLWMAPNLITLLGFLFVVANFILALVITDFTNPGPSWIYVSFAIAIWLYSTFDNVDGKQARRTNSSSPLGELFDHGVDALNCTTGAFINTAGLLLGLGGYTYLAVMISTITFFFATWETYYTGTLFLGYINGPTEGLIISVITLLISGICGPNIWKHPLFIKSGYPMIDSLELGQALMWSMFVLMVTTQVPVSIYRCLRACYHKGIPRIYAIKNSFPFLIMLISATIWAFSPKSIVMPQNTVLFLVAWGIANGKINALLILRHVTHTGYPTYYRLVLPFVIGAGLSIARDYYHFEIFGPVQEHGYILSMLVYISIDYVLWALKVVEQICQHLNIKCFSIKKVQKVEADDIPLPDEHYLEELPPHVEEEVLLKQEVVESNSPKKTLNGRSVSPERKPIQSETTQKTPTKVNGTLHESNETPRKTSNDTPKVNGTPRKRNTGTPKTPKIDPDTPRRITRSQTKMMQ